MDLNDMSTQLLYLTVPVYTKNNKGELTIGAGFIFSYQGDSEYTIPLLITNYHVVRDATECAIELYISRNGEPINKTVYVEVDIDVIRKNKLGELDLVAIPLATIILSQKNKGVDIFYRTINQKLIPSMDQINKMSAIADITFIGYPNGIVDNFSKLPLIRKGITSTPVWNKFCGEEVFLIDAGVYKGSSGSPVFIINQGSYNEGNNVIIGSRILFIGVIYQTLLGNNNDNETYVGLGKVINSNAMYDELKILVSKLLHNSENNTLV